jgi:hypothetical protein
MTRQSFNARNRIVAFIVFIAILFGPGVRDRDYSVPEGDRKYFSTLLVGYHSPTGLLFAGH